jgi:hypothetical protein
MNRKNERRFLIFFYIYAGVLFAIRNGVTFRPKSGLERTLLSSFQKNWAKTVVRCKENGGTPIVLYLIIQLG